ncbi:hypothetical protein ACTFIV_006324 [Dictyostelium citrinum]
MELAETTNTTTISNSEIKSEPIVEDQKQKLNETNTITNHSEIVEPTPKTETNEIKDRSRGLEAKIKPEFVLPYKKMEKVEVDKADKAAKKKEFRNQLKESMNDKLCPKISKGLECEFKETCKFSHDVEKYLASKPKSIGICQNFQNYGECKFGLNCYFGECHIVDNKTIVNKELVGKVEPIKIINEVSNEIQNQLKSNNYPFPKSEIYFKENGITVRQFKGKNNNKQQKNDNKRKENEKENDEDKSNKKIKLEDENTTTTTTTETKEKENPTTTTTTNTTALKEESKQSNEHTEIDIMTPLKPNEKKRINFENQLILAPLTTVGNLPFRRICKKLGADITIGEMALTTKLLEGTKSELALLKRHPCEDKFGVQICGSYVDTAVKCAEFIENEIDADFVDINSGCPIDLVCNMGAGAALMERPKKVEQLLRGISSHLSCPTTIKIRIGKSEDAPTAHKLIPSLGEWGACAVTLHGRSRAQRYSRLANWDYIKQCSEVSKIPLIGNGDIYNYQDVVNIYDSSKVSSIMIARGALIKPWIFTEIKEKREWDISASERLDFIRDFANYGLDHWGSDRIGVDNTRKFLLNWLSFSHRYIPVGLLDKVHYMNERPPAYFGRSDLETLLASTQVKDWIKITEMFLGPVPSDYVFVPKHNSNSYESQG